MMRARALDVAIGACALIVTGLMPLLAPPCQGAGAPLASILVNLSFVTTLLGLVAIALWHTTKHGPE